MGMHVLLFNCVEQSANFYCSFRVLSFQSMPNVFKISFTIISFYFSHFSFPPLVALFFAFDKCTHTSTFRLKVVMPKTKIYNQENTAKHINQRGHHLLLPILEIYESHFRTNFERRFVAKLKMFHIY